MNRIFKFFNSLFFAFLLATLSTASIHLKTLSYHKPIKKSYIKKAPLAGYCQISKVSGLPKTGIIRGHYKRTRKGITYVNKYARSR